MKSLLILFLSVLLNASRLILNPSIFHTISSFQLFTSPNVVFFAFINNKAILCHEKSPFQSFSFSLFKFAFYFQILPHFDNYYSFLIIIFHNYKFFPKVRDLSISGWMNIKQARSGNIRFINHIELNQKVINHIDLEKIWGVGNHFHCSQYFWFICLWFCGYFHFWFYICSTRKNWYIITKNFTTLTSMSTNWHLIFH